MYQINVADIEKWTKQIEGTTDKIDAFDNKAEEALSNMKAYINDSKYFREKGDIIRSFEAVVFASAILETCLQLGAFVIKEEQRL